LGYTIAKRGVMYLSLSNQGLVETFAKWDIGEFDSFVVETTVDIFIVKDEHGTGEFAYKILDKKR
jgi:6-phosphogluconate dehydrogenase